MKIAILIATLKPYGAERAAVRLAEGFSKHGIDVTLFLIDCKSEMELTIPVISILHGGKLNLFTEFLFAPLQYLRLRAAIKKEKVDVVISFMERANIFNLLIPGNHRRIISIRTFLSGGFKTNGILRTIPTRLFYKLLLKRADLIGCVSRAAVDDFMEMFPVDPNKIAVFTNPRDLDEITAGSQEPLKDEHRDLLAGNSIIHVGRFTRDKGQWYLIRAMPKILESVPDAKLILLGEGLLGDYLEKLVAELGLKGKVHFLGFQENPFKFMSRAAVFACSSTREGLPGALVEALICKVAIVSADCKSGPRELLAPGSDISTVASGIELAEYGILIPPFDGKFKDADTPLTAEESTMAEALVMSLQDDGLRQRYKQAGSARTAAFKTDRIIEHWLSVLAKL